MTFNISNLSSKYPYFNRAYILSVKTQSHTTVHASVAHHTQDGYEHGREGKKPMLGASKEASK